MEDREIIIKSVDDEISQLQKLIADVGDKIKELESQKDHCKRLLQGFEWYTAHLKGEKIEVPEKQQILEI